MSAPAVECDHPIEACWEGKCWLCQWVYDPHPHMRAQRQDSLQDQIQDVMRAAARMGCYDAHDWMRARWGQR